MYGIINKRNAQNVKNTMLDRLISLLAPHLCCSCGAVGALLCDSCKYNIVSESYSLCIACGQAQNAQAGCNRCRLPYAAAWCVGDHSAILQRLIGIYKFQNAYAARKDLADMVLERIPYLPPETIVVPVPTVAGHIRERGYDHAYEIARIIAKQRGLACKKMLSRRSTTQQRDANRSVRIQQAKDAFTSRHSIDSVPCLLIDDVVTTGATVRYAAQTLKQAGASEVWVAVLARQPLD
jgi:ComF family protein